MLIDMYKLEVVYIRLQEYTPINADKITSKENIQIYESEFNEFTNEVDDDRCLAIGNGFFIVKNQDFNYDSKTRVIIKNPPKPKQDIPSTFSEHLQEKVREVHKELNLNQEQLKKIKKELDKKLKCNLELVEQIKLIEKLAKEYKNKTDLDNIFNLFLKRKSAFYDCLNDDLGKLNDEYKSEVIKHLESISSAINRKLEYL